MANVLLTLFTAFLVSLLVMPLLRQIAFRTGLLDTPNERSSHTRPTPRNGGIGILLAVAAALTVAGHKPDRPTAVLLAVSAGVAVLGAIDDVRSLRQTPKLFIQILLGLIAMTAAGLSVRNLALPMLGDIPTSGALLFVLTLLWLVGCLNAYNFMDGINGIAGMQAVIAGTTYAVLAARSGDYFIQTLAISIVGAAIGFLIWNLPRGLIFMGDAGSSTLGFLFGAFTLRTALGDLPIVASALPLFPFVFDTLTTFIIRIKRRERFYSVAHKLHFYQRLVTLGWSHRAVTLLYAFLATICCAAALSYQRATDTERLALLLLVVVVHVILAYSVTRSRAGQP